MALRTVATVLIVVTSLVLLTMFLSEPLLAIGDALKGVGNYSIAGTNASANLDRNIGAWLNMFWIAVFGVMLWGTFRVLRRELTRGRRR